MVYPLGGSSLVIIQTELEFRIVGFCGVIKTFWCKARTDNKLKPRQTTVVQESNRVSEMGGERLFTTPAVHVSERVMSLKQNNTLGERKRTGREFAC